MRTLYLSILKQCFCKRKYFIFIYFINRYTTIIIRKLSFDAKSKTLISTLAEQFRHFDAIVIFFSFKKENIHLWHLNIWQRHICILIKFQNLLIPAVFYFPFPLPAFEFIFFFQIFQTNPACILYLCIQFTSNMN